jgi:methylmalonyl-CoA mutase N-terminal domain/subunit
MQNEIQEAAYRYQREVERKAQIVVGVNAFQVDETPELEQLAVDPSIEESQKKRLSNIRAERDHNRVSELLSYLETAARGEENLMPIFIECVENMVTLGEICHVLRQVWGEYQPPAWI